MTLTEFIRARIAEDDARGARARHTLLCLRYTWIIEELSIVYADHPDYREEWRP